MLQLKIYTDINKFYDDTIDLLMCHEAQNVIPLGNIIIGKEGKDKTEWREPENWFMATVNDSGIIQLIALMTPPKGLTLYAKNNIINGDAINCLIKGMEKYVVTGVMSTKEMAFHFADAYCNSKNMTYETKDDLRLHELSAVNPEIPQIGKLRLAEESDMYFLPYWLEAFQVCMNKNGITMNEPQDEMSYLHIISRRDRYILEHEGIPVSMAAITRKMQTCCNIAGVYTPPYFRGKGYASSCVAKVSQIILDQGFAKSILTTDLSNPTSNKIYQKIGYRPICDSVMLNFSYPKSEGS